MTDFRFAPHQLGMRFKSVINVVGFAGFGGTCLGFQMATGESPDVAINHWPEAIANHALNHPETRHYCEDIFEVSPVEACAGRRVRGFWISPDCTHFSQAKGGKPVSNKRRGLAKIALKWAAQVRPDVIFLENVPEFLKWGPLDKKKRPVAARAGEYFKRYVRDLERLGYKVEWRTLVACDFGAPTSRKRLFLVARSDGQPIEWPTPTHGPGRIPYRTAAECIDWSIPGESIFDRDKPLVPATLRRVAEGMRRHVLTSARPYLVQVSYGERPGQAPRVMSLGDPLGTVVAGGVKHAVVSFVVKHFGGLNGHQTPGLSLAKPLSTVTVTDHHGLVAVHVEKYNGTAVGASLLDPLHTVTTKDRFFLVQTFFSKHGLGEPVVVIEGERYWIVDICMRPLTPRELARAQGFPDSYILTGSRKSQVAKIGNSVCPQVAAALVGANLNAEIARAA